MTIQTRPGIKCFWTQGTRAFFDTIWIVTYMNVLLQLVLRACTILTSGKRAWTGTAGTRIWIVFLQMLIEMGLVVSGKATACKWTCDHDPPVLVNIANVLSQIRALIGFEFVQITLKHFFLQVISNMRIQAIFGEEPWGAQGTGSFVVSGVWRFWTCIFKVGFWLVR